LRELRKDVVSVAELLSAVDTQAVNQFGVLCTSGGCHEPQPVESEFRSPMCDVNNRRRFAFPLFIACAQLGKVVFCVYCPCSCPRRRLLSSKRRYKLPRPVVGVGGGGTWHVVVAASADS
jgi:hypothetical protein